MIAKLVPLKDAAAGLGVTISALRAEVQRGTLSVRRIGKNFYTTTQDLDAMVETCRVKPSPPASPIARPETNGSSETDDATSELDALKESMRVLSSPSLPTSPAERRKLLAKVVDLRPSR